MFMMSFRLRRIPVLIGCGVLALVIVFGVFGLRDVFAQNASEEVLGRQERRSNAARTNEDRIAFLASYGWETDPQALEILEVVIPEEFDEIYSAYNDMQKSQGFDLSNNAGRRVKRYAYRITNYPGTDDPVRAHILVYRDRVIGGDVCSEIAGSFMHGFASPKAQ